MGSQVERARCEDEHEGETYALVRVQNLEVRKAGLRCAELVCGLAVNSYTPWIIPLHFADCVCTFSEARDIPDTLLPD